MKILKIGAKWCSGCLVMGPRFKQIEKEIPNLITEYYEYDDNKEIIEKYKVGSNIPVFIFLDKNNDEILRLNGEVEKDKLVQIINENIGK